MPHETAITFFPENIAYGAFEQTLLGFLAAYNFPAPLQIIIIKLYAWYYDVNLEESEKSITQYKSLNEFFTRALKSKSRPLAKGKNSIISPVDGILSGLGKNTQGVSAASQGQGILPIRAPGKFGIHKAFFRRLLSFILFISQRLSSDLQPLCSQSFLLINTYQADS